MKYFKSLLRTSYFTLIICATALLQPVQAQFLDVDVTHPYFHSIADLYEAEIIKGYDVDGERFFRPRQSINRAEALKILMLSAELELDGNTGSQFPDVPSQAWFTDFVRTAASRGIVRGYPDGRFYPEVKVTRAEFLKMMIEAFEIPLEEVSDEEWFTPYLKTAKNWRLLPEEEDPHTHINRGEVAEIIFRTKQIAQENFTTKYTYQAQGKASYYNEGFAGRSTANGETYDPYAFTAAHRTLPFNTRLRVYNEDGKFIVVRINDRGPYHEDRIIDLSQRAFEELAPISRGVITVSFDVLSDPQDQTPVIPEQIRPNLALESRSLTVPSELYDRLREQTTTETKTKTLPASQPLFTESISSLPTDFYENVELRNFIPQTLAQGQVLKFSGRITDNRRPSTVTVFLKNKATSEQQIFTDKMSGQNFELAVPFYKVGHYEMGLVFDQERRSRVGELEVLAAPSERRFPSSDVRFASDLEVEVQPEESEVVWRWSTGITRLSRLTFTQGNKIKTLVFENGQSHFALPYTFLSDDFGTNSDLIISLEQAESRDGSWQNQQTNWKAVTSKKFRLWAGFPDKELANTIGFSQFSRYYRDLAPVTFRGQVLSSEVRIADDIYITDADGNIRTVEPNFTSTRGFEFEVDPAKYGRYVIEIVSNAGEILFNRAIYFSETEVLPVLPKTYTDIKIGNKSGILHWTNTIRSLSRRPVLVSDPELETAAQRYAERMAKEDFIGHVAPDGETLQDRIEGLDFTGFGENLAYGSTLELALNGLEDSASHYKNIKNSTWKKIGIGLTKNSAGDFYVVQIFAK